jgi:signal peptidase I
VPWLRRTAVLVVLAAVVLVVVRSFLVQSYVLPTASMEPTLRQGDRVVVPPASYWFGEVGRGDVVVFDGDGVFDPPEPESNHLVAAGTALAAALGLPTGASAYAKRVLGLPGEHVACCDPAGRITVDGEPLDEPWLADGQVASRTTFDVVVPEGRIWVMGDNRDKSADSRAHLGDPGGGTVPMDRIVGRVVAVYWPLNRLGAVTDGEESS